MYAPSSDYTLTAPTRDGGRDAYGYYKLGPVISARDIVDILKRQGIATPSEIETWLQREFPTDAPAV